MNADEAGPQEGSTSLFAVFALSMLSLFVFPYTISKVVKAAAPERESRPWEKVSEREKKMIEKEEEKHWRQTRLSSGSAAPFLSSWLPI